MKFADFFLMPRLVQICAHYVKRLLTPQNVLAVMVLAHLHNSHDLLLFCCEFLIQNFKAIKASQEWMIFRTNVEPSIQRELMQEIIKYKEQDFFVQHSIEAFIRENSVVAKNRIEPEYSHNQHGFKNTKPPLEQQMESSSNSSGSCFSKVSSIDDGITLPTFQLATSSSELTLSKLSI